ncbi:MAG: sugar ABC transporter permease [Actinocatenispora sp.]
MTTTTVASLPAVGDPPRVRARTRHDSRSGWGLMAPFTVLYLLFLIGPALYGLLMSFFDGSSARTGLGPFAGVDNYAEALGSGDFWSSMGHTVFFTVLTTPPLVVIAMAMAVLVDRLRRGRWFFRLVFFAPYVVPVTCAALVFGWLYTPETGLYSTWLAKIGITSPAWLADPNWAMISVAMMTVWWTVGFNFVLYLAGLQDIPREVYEASAVDGASPWDQLRRITVPLLARTTLLVTMLQILASLKVFDQIYLLTAGGPNYSTRPVIEYVYDVGFTDFRTGYGAATSMLYFVVVLAISAVWLAVSRRQSRRG